MNYTNILRNRARRLVAVCVLGLAAFLVSSQTTIAASWNGIEPLKSRRADVERVLGQPTKDQPGDNGMLHFNVAGGRVTIFFIDARFVTAKRLSKDKEGTVRQIVLQHENSSDTPESMGLVSKPDFKREDGDHNVTKYSNAKEGIVYTFIGGTLKTSYFVPSLEQWTNAQK